MAIQVEQIAASALREWLLQKLPAKVAAVNAERAPVLRATLPGPYVIPASGALNVGAVTGTYTTVALTAGSRTAAQVGAELVAALAGIGITAGADAASRLYITTTAAPVTEDRVVALGPDGAVATNHLFGWYAGGERVIRHPLVAPSATGVSDGWPVTLDMGGAGAFWVIIGDRRSAPAPGLRRDQYLVDLDLDIMRPEPNVANHRTREHIASVVRSVREVLVLEDGGRQLGRAANGDIMLVEELSCQIRAMPFQFSNVNLGPMDVAALKLRVKVFERQAA